MTICLYQFLLSIQFYYTCLFITACLMFVCFHGFIFHACVSLWLLLLVLDVIFVIFVPCSVGPIPLKTKKQKQQQQQQKLFHVAIIPLSPARCSLTSRYATSKPP